ncbi:MAG: DUF1080 domain-containing protein [Patescibacteria group bacterium]|nr:DUF1080 domain-containing protein [Patescibacteria group bacterium]
MKRILAMSVLVAAGLAVGLAGMVRAAESPAAEERFTSLFDGRTLDGWEGNLDWFRIEQGAIVAGSLERRIPNNEFLATTARFDNFELRLEFKVLGEDANAGVQIRSERIPNNHEMIGYQADLGQNWWGCLYDESRRKRILAGPPEADRKKPVRLGDWNEYRIRCEGPRVQLWINGVQTVDYTEPDANIVPNGLIALQIHSGPPAEAWYRNIRIKRLAP